MLMNLMAWRYPSGFADRPWWRRVRLWAVAFMSLGISFLLISLAIIGVLVFGPNGIDFPLGKYVIPSIMIGILSENIMRSEAMIEFTQLTG